MSLLWGAGNKVVFAHRGEGGRFYFFDQGVVAFPIMSLNKARLSLPSSLVIKILRRKLYCFPLLEKWEMELEAATEG